MNQPKKILFVSETILDQKASYELEKILSESGLSEHPIIHTSVFKSPTPSGFIPDFTGFLIPNKEARSANGNISLKPEYESHLESLRGLLERIRPELVIAAGNWPLWALSDKATISTKAGYRLPSGIASWRGSQIRTRDSLGSAPLLPIIHPGSILREWGLRATTVHDLRSRGGRYLSDALDWNPPTNTRTIHRPSKEDLETFFTSIKLRLDSDLHKELWLSVDLETYKRRFISVVGLADAETELCIPFFFKDGDETINYWSLEDEQWIWTELKYILEHPGIRIIGQNFIYDTEWFHRYYNIRALISFDTMVAHHLLFPGTPKSLDVLASLYCNHYIYWKDESGDWDNFPEDADRYWRYNCKDTRATFEIAQVLRTLITKSGMEELYNFQIDQWHLSREMTLKGMHFNIDLQKEMRSQLLAEAENLSNWLLYSVPEFCRYTSTGKPWYDSPKGVMDLLYSRLGLDPILHKKTKKPSSDANAIEELRRKPGMKWMNPIFDRLEALRSIDVFTSNFLDARVSPSGRMPCCFNIAHPETFRWSSNKNGFGEGLNGQNIPGESRE